MDVSSSAPPGGSGHGASRSVQILHWGAVVLWAGLIFYLSSRSRLPQPFDSTFLPNVAHFLEYAVLTLLLVRALVSGGLGRGPAVRMAVVLALAYAASDELHQSFVPNRHPSAADLFVDALGIGTVAIAVGTRSRTAEPPPR
jgi:VanZ family protein